MIKKLWHRIVSSAPARREGGFVEPLEPRLLMAAGPRVTSVIADNRGLVFIDFDRAVDPATITTKSTAIYTAGRDKKLGTKDDVRQKIQVLLEPSGRQLTLLRPLKANTPYRVFLSGSLIKTKKGVPLDGEFRGVKKPSGNGKPGGDFDIVTRVPKVPVARFLTLAGDIEVKLFQKETPRTVKNFLAYANRKAWDGTFFHRSEDYQDGTPFVIQGGGYRISSDDEIVSIPSRPPVVNEPVIPSPRNVFGTIAMARVDDGDPETHDDENSATNQWFFNLSNNSQSLDNQNGGFTAFGRIIGKNSRNVINFIGSRPTIDLNPSIPGTAFQSVPVHNNNFVFVTRVAIKMDVVKTKR